MLNKIAIASCFVFIPKTNIKSFNEPYIWDPLIALKTFIWELSNMKFCLFILFSFTHGWLNNDIIYLHFYLYLNTYISSSKSSSEASQFLLVEFSWKSNQRRFGCTLDWVFIGNSIWNFLYMLIFSLVFVDLNSSIQDEMNKRMNKVSSKSSWESIWTNKTTLKGSTKTLFLPLSLLPRVQHKYFFRLAFFLFFFFSFPLRLI